MIQRIEELSTNAWPALQTLVYDGWIVRFASGYTRRANSVSPLYGSSLPLEEKLASCETLYQSMGLHSAFKMTAAVCPAGLDEALERRAYRREALTSVQLLDLATPVQPADEGVELAGELTEDWLADYRRMSGVDARHTATLRQMLQSIVPAHGFARLMHSGHAIACGLGVQQGGFIGLFDIVTQAEYRRQGYGRRLMQRLLAWGQQNGAQAAYLQVMLENQPAMRLYAGLGFREIYQYWYRIQP